MVGRIVPALHAVADAADGYSGDGGRGRRGSRGCAKDIDLWRLRGELKMWSGEFCNHGYDITGPLE